MHSDPLNFEERLVRLLIGPLRPIAWRLLKWRGVEFPPKVPFGDGLRLPHGAVGLVVHENTEIGERVRLYQGVTIGRADQYLPRELVRPGGGVTIGDDVIISAGAVVLFRGGERVTLGDGCVIGANAVVTRSIPAGEIWAGQPARRISRNPMFRP